MKKLLVVLLVLAFVIGSGSGFWSKPAVAHTGKERRVMLCTAWPWDNDFYQSDNPSPPDTSTLSTAENQVKMQNGQKNPTSDRTDSRARNPFHRILCALWGVIFPESF